MPWSRDILSPLWIDLRCCVGMPLGTFIYMLRSVSVDCPEEDGYRDQSENTRVVDESLPGRSNRGTRWARRTGAPAFNGGWVLPLRRSPAHAKVCDSPAFRSRLTRLAGSIAALEVKVEVVSTVDAAKDDVLSEFVHRIVGRTARNILEMLVRDGFVEMFVCEGDTGPSVVCGRPPTSAGTRGYSASTRMWPFAPPGMPKTSLIGVVQDEPLLHGKGLRGTPSDVVFGDSVPKRRRNTPVFLDPGRFVLPTCANKVDSTSSLLSALAHADDQIEGVQVPDQSLLPASKYNSTIYLVPGPDYRALPVSGDISAVITPLRPVVEPILLLETARRAQAHALSMALDPSLVVSVPNVVLSTLDRAASDSAASTSIPIRALNDRMLGPLSAFDLGQDRHAVLEEAISLQERADVARADGARDAQAGLEEQVASVKGNVAALAYEEPQGHLVGRDGWPRPISGTRNGPRRVNTIPSVMSVSTSGAERFLPALETTAVRERAVETALSHVWPESHGSRSDRGRVASETETRAVRDAWAVRLAEAVRLAVVMCLVSTRAETTASIRKAARTSTGPEELGQKLPTWIRVNPTLAAAILSVDLTALNIRFVEPVDDV